MMDNNTPKDLMGDIAPDRNSTALPVELADYDSYHTWIQLASATEGSSSKNTSKGVYKFFFCAIKAASTLLRTCNF